MARQVINSCPSLDWFPAGSERTDHSHPLATTPAVRSLSLPDRETSPRTKAKRPGAAHLSGTRRSSRHRALPLAAPFLALTSAPILPSADPTPPWKHPLPHRRLVRPSAARESCSTAAGPAPGASSSAARAPAQPGGQRPREAVDTPQTTSSGFPCLTSTAMERRRPRSHTSTRGSPRYSLL